MVGGGGEIEKVKFRRDKFYILLNLYILGLLCIIVSIPVYIALLSIKDYKMLLFYAGGLLLGFLIMAKGYYDRGYLTSSITFTENEIISREKISGKKEIKEIRLPWNEIKIIYRTLYTSGKTLVFWGEHGEKIWFGTNKKIEKYILTNHPELRPILPDKKDVRRWDNWDKKLKIYGPFVFEPKDKK